MGLYSVMLVDDEEAVRQAIARRLDWEEIGFKVIAAAENGEEALEMAEKLQPDVVMTDIKMPFMDGLTLCHKLKENQKNTKVVIFSGFDEFEYAKEAIKLEVEEYILKPIDSVELKHIFERLKTVLDKEIDEKRNLDMLHNYYLKSLPIMKEQFLTGLLEGRIAEERIAEMNRSYEVNLKSPYYAVAIVKMDTSRNILNLSLKQIIEESLQGTAEVKSFLYLDVVAVILMAHDENHFMRIIRELDQSCRIANRILEANVTAGIGQLVDRLAGLSKSYEGALDAVDYRVLLEANQAIYILDIQPSLNSSFGIDDQDVQRILKDIKLGEQEELQRDVEQLILHLKSAKVSLHKYHALMMEIISELLKLGRAYQVDLDQFFEEEFRVYRDIREFESLEELGKWLYETCLSLSTSIHRERTDTTKLMVEKARHYIDKHYTDEELSVEVLCGYLGVSAAYFSTIFKRETGKSFVMYLTSVRMEAALKLLNSTEDKTYIISGKVGYTEPNYFSYVFKKYYGVSPSKYRINKVEKHEEKN